MLWSVVIDHHLEASLFSGPEEFAIA